MKNGKKIASLLLVVVLMAAVLLSGCSEPTKPPKKPYELGNVVILGDSYSTFEGYIPKGYSCWYWTENHPNKNNTDVIQKEQTWWHLLMEATGANLVRNDSFSGSPICNTGYNAADATHFSFITRLDKLIEEDFFNQNEIDTLIIFGGTNDDWANVPLGEITYDWGTPEKKQVIPAITYMISRCIENNIRPLVILNTQLDTKIANAFKEICAELMVDLVVLESISKTSGHPNIAGMQQISEQIQAFIASK